MFSQSKKISIIIPSYNDYRVLNTIKSVHSFDDTGDVQAVIIDGGSSSDLIQKIKNSLKSSDILISEPDKGIFDALNKGLKVSKGQIIGWLGADDFFMPNFKSSMVLKGIENYDLYIVNTVHVKGGVVNRITPSWPSKFGLNKFGFNNPHFSTFGVSHLFKSESFSLTDKAADIHYFLKIFKKNPKVKTENINGVCMELGGFSNSSSKSIFQRNFDLLRIYRQYLPFSLALMAVFLKMFYKIPFVFYYKLRPVKNVYFC